MNKLSGVLAICVSLTHPVAAQTTVEPTFSPAQLYALGVQLLQDNKVNDAARVADGLLKRNPDDVLALILAAEAVIIQGDFAAGLKFARRAYFKSTRPNDKFGAARLAALANSEMRHDTLAQLWLRRARQYAPNAETAENVADDYRFLRGRNPWSSSLRFGVAPSNNVNNGSAKDRSTFFDLPVEFGLDLSAQALSGFTFSGGVQTSYRLRETRQSISQATFGYNAQTHALSSASQIALQDEYDASIVACEATDTASGRETCLSLVNPISKGSDFSDATLTFGFNHKQIFSEGSQPTDFDVKIGKTWYGSDGYADFVDGRISHSWRIGDKDQISGSIAAQKRRFDSGSPDVRTAGISTRWSHSLASGDRFSLGVNLRQSKSETGDSDYTSVTYRAGYNIAKPVLGMQLGFNIDAEHRSFDFSDLASKAREDNSLGLNMSILLTEVEFYGFQPIINLDARRNESTLNLFDRDYGSIGFDLRSSF